MRFVPGPELNATLNATSATLLMAGFLAIKMKQVALHKTCMLAACAVSTLFLTSYVAYHLRAGSMHFHGTGWSRSLYFTILISHTILAIVIVPMVARTLFLAARQRFADHMAMARWTLPLWFYVSVTGVIVYLMLYHL